MKEIELKSLTKIYSPDILALKEVSLTVEQGEFVFLTGQSGCGKSTFLKLLSGQDMPTSGEVWVRGHCTSRLTHYQVPFYRRMFGWSLPNGKSGGESRDRRTIERKGKKGGRTVKRLRPPFLNYFFL